MFCLECRYAIISAVVVTVDTNVLFQALYSSSGASNAIFRLIRAGEVRLALSVPVYGEYQDVLSRPAVRKDIGLTQSEVLAVLQFIAFVGTPVPVHFQMRPNLRDEGDNMFVELAYASGSAHLITKNTRDFMVNADLNLGQLSIVTPAEFMRMWRKDHGDKT